MKAFKYLVFIIFFSISISAYSGEQYYMNRPAQGLTIDNKYSSIPALCSAFASKDSNAMIEVSYKSHDSSACIFIQKYTDGQIINQNYRIPYNKVQIQCESGIVPVTLKVPVSSGKMVCVDSCQYSLTKCVDVDFESGMTCDGVNEGRDCGTPPPTTTPTTPPVTQDPTNPTDKTDEQKTFENIMNVIGEKLDGIKDAITGGNQNQNGGDTGGSNGGTTGGDVTVNVDMSETNAKIDETNSLIDELTKWFQGEDLGDDIFGDSEPPEKELTPQQLETNIFSGRAQCPADAKLSFNLLGGKTFTKTFEFTDWCDNLEIFGSLILIASYLFGAYIIVSKS